MKTSPYKEKPNVFFCFSFKCPCPIFVSTTKKCFFLQEMKKSFNVNLFSENTKQVKVFKPWLKSLTTLNFIYGMYY